MSTHDNQALEIDVVRELDAVEVTIDGFGFSGEGFARLSDGWLSVRGALPGERVVVRVQQGQRENLRRLWAELLEVTRASADRRDPSCERASFCRGCQLRHATVSAELAFHAQTVAQVIERYALDGEPVPEDVEIIAPEAMARDDSERMRTSLSVGEDGSLGLVAPGRDGLVGMSTCPALSSATRRLVTQVEAALADHDPAGLGLERVRVASPAHGRGRVVLVAREEGAELDELVRALDERLGPLVGLFVERGSESEHVRGPDEMRVSVGELMIGVGSGAWFHATQAPAEALYEALPDWLSPAAHEHLLEVGCGVGTVGLTVADSVASITGIDASVAAVHSAELNAAANEVDHARYITADWERGLRDLTLEGATFDVAVINPMREPVGERALAYLARLGVSRVLYMGPSPVSAARDIGVLQQMGFTLGRLGAVALHPGTYHCMLLGVLEA